jgi:hypothetical protein
MEWKTIKNSGKVIENYSNIPDGTGKIKTREFLFETMVEFAKVSSRIFDNTYDLAFYYSEKQLSTIFLPAFYNLGYGAFQELPTRRNEKNLIDSYGYLDYWVQKDNKWIYLIESKHAWHFLNGKVRKETINKIDKSIGQLKQINGSALSDLSIEKSTYKISMITMPIWYTIPKSENIDEDSEYLIHPDDLSGTINSIVDSLKEKVSWIGTWSVHPKMQIALPSQHINKLRVYPGVVFLSTIVN